MYHILDLAGKQNPSTFIFCLENFLLLENVWKLIIIEAHAGFGENYGYEILHLTFIFFQGQDTKCNFTIDCDTTTHFDNEAKSLSRRFFYKVDERH